jgi:hypothetical protein
MRLELALGFDILLSLNGTWFAGAIFNLDRITTEALFRLEQ